MESIFVKFKPGQGGHARFSEIDFSAGMIGIEIIHTLYEDGFPYLEIPEKGKAELYATGSKMENVQILIKSRRGKKQK